MLSLIVTLTAVETYLPPIGPLASFRPGLSNIVVMYILFFIGKKEAYLTAFLKSSFVFITRGIMACSLSLGGGLLSLTAIVIIKRVTKNRTSLLIQSIFGAISHNLGQIIVINIILNTLYYFYYLPLFIILGIITGSLTGVLLKYIMPALDRLK